MSLDVQQPDPVVIVWRNRIPHTCTLMYWGRGWRFCEGWFRRVYLWSVHAPVDGGETITFDLRHMKVGTRHEFECYHHDGSAIKTGGPAEPPDA